MSEERATGGSVAEAPVAFGQRLAGSEAFKAMFREGMALVEETATYLDGDGRRESQHAVARAASLAYATESMRLTTRLMQLASWLLLQRAVNEGDLSVDQASQERAKVKLGGSRPRREGQAWDELPEQLARPHRPVAAPAGAGDPPRRGAARRSAGDESAADQIRVPARR